MSNSLDPNINLPPGSFGDVNTRDVNATPGDLKQPYPPPPELGGITSGELPVISPFPQAGTGLQEPGDVRRESDGFQVNAPHDDEGTQTGDSGSHA